MPVEQRVRRARAQDVDRHLAAWMRERRIMLGLPQQWLAELIGVSNQQVHKYEKGINRVPAGRLCSIAQALEVEVGYFYEGLRTTVGFIPPAQERMLVDLARNYLNIPVPKHRAAIVALARGLAEADNADEPAAEALVEGHPRGMQHERRKKGTKHSCRLDALARLAHNRCG